MLKNRRNWLIRSAVVCLLVSLLLSMPCVACGETTLPFIRIDRDNPDYWQGELSSVRLIAGQLYELQEMDAESGVDPDFMPSEEGMDTLCISGSAQFSVPKRGWIPCASQAARSSRYRSSKSLPLLCGNAPETELSMSLICGRKAMVL